MTSLILFSISFHPNSNTWIVRAFTFGFFFKKKKISFNYFKSYFIIFTRPFYNKPNFSNFIFFPIYIYIFTLSLSLSLSFSLSLSLSRHWPQPKKEEATTPPHQPQTQRLQEKNTQQPQYISHHNHNSRHHATHQNLFKKTNNQP